MLQLHCARAEFKNHTTGRHARRLTFGLTQDFAQGFDGLRPGFLQLVHGVAPRVLPGFAEALDNVLIFQPSPSRRVGEPYGPRRGLRGGMCEHGLNELLHFLGLSAAKTFQNLSKPFIRPVCAGIALAAP
jgi:hypothetical protein